MTVVPEGFSVSDESWVKQLILCATRKIEYLPKGEFRTILSQNERFRVCGMAGWLSDIAKQEFRDAVGRTRLYAALAFVARMPCEDIPVISFSVMRPHLLAVMERIWEVRIFSQTASKYELYPELHSFVDSTLPGGINLNFSADTCRHFPVNEEHALRAKFAVETRPTSICFNVVTGIEPQEYLNVTLANTFEIKEILRIREPVSIPVAFKKASYPYQLRVNQKLVEGRQKPLASVMLTDMCKRLKRLMRLLFGVVNRDRIHDTNHTFRSASFSPHEKGKTTFKRSPPSL
jgi:hypothetical protein